MLDEYINARHKNQKQIQDMTKLIDRLKLKINECENFID